MDDLKKIVGKPQLRREWYNTLYDQNPVFVTYGIKESMRSGVCTLSRPGSSFPVHSSFFLCFSVVAERDGSKKERYE
jgi:hypothetical protein